MILTATIGVGPITPGFVVLGAYPVGSVLRAVVVGMTTVLPNSAIVGFAVSESAAADLANFNSGASLFGGFVNIAGGSQHPLLPIRCTATTTPWIRFPVHYPVTSGPVNVVVFVSAADNVVLAVGCEAEAERLIRPGLDEGVPVRLGGVVGGVMEELRAAGEAARA